MTKYKITNTQSGVVIGIYKAESKVAALDAMGVDAGYLSHEDACKQCGCNSDDLFIEEVPGV